MEDIKSLSDDELINKLKEYGEHVGPMTASTRSIFERRLLKHLCPSEGEEVTGPVLSSTEAVIASSRVKAILAEDVQSMEPSVYFGVQLPAEVKDWESIRVFIDKTDALKLMKKYPGSRFKAFATRPEAERFSKTSPETFVPQSPSFIGGAQPGPIPMRQPINEGSTFRSVKTQDLVKLRKLLEMGNVVGARDLIWSNPRYLINSGDTPTILQEGFRYNALHVTAMKNQARSAQLILDILADPAFMHLLYPTEPIESRDNRMQFLVDLYLNTPDKGNCECALHFACKFGHVEVVDVLASHPKLDKRRRNKYGETPFDSICVRAKSASTDIKDRIKELLEDRYYIPLWRSDDNSCSPHVASPWSPTVDGDTPWKSPASLGSPSSTPGRNGSPRESPVSVKAYAGPMTSKQAQRFRKNWLTPPSASPKERKQMADIRRRDPEKGLERTGRAVAQNMQVSWCEYWNFLDCYVDIASDDGLNKLEDHLQQHYDAQQRDQELDNELKQVASRLDKLHLSSPENSAKNLAKKLGFGDTLVLYLDKNDSQIDSQHGPKTFNEEKHKHRLIGDGDADSVSCRIANDNNHLTNVDTNFGLSETILTNGANDTEHNEVHRNISTSDESSLTGTRADTQSLSSISEHQGVSELSALVVDPWDISSRLDNLSYIDDSDSDSSVTSYYTAMDFEESDTESLFTPPQSMTPAEEDPLFTCFINGGEPTKLDVDVVQALEHVVVDSDRFPRIAEWKRLIQGYSADEYKRWGSPRRLKKTIPSVLLTTPGCSSMLHSPLRAYLTPTRGRSNLLHGNPSLSSSAQRVVYRSPSFSPSSPSSESESDSSLDSSVLSVRTNLMSSFLSDK